MRSLLARNPAVTPIGNLPGCGPGRTEKKTVIRKGGRLITVIVRDKVVAEDPFLVAVKAAAFALRNGSDYTLAPTPRSVRDFLIKSNVGVI